MKTPSRLPILLAIGVLAILGGFVLGALLTGRGQTAASPSPDGVASGSATAPAPTDEPTTEPTIEPSPSAEASPSPSASAAADRATITFTNLRLDAQDDPAGADRVLRFETGPGPITVELTSITPQGATVFCLNTPTKELGCRTSGEGRLSAKTTKPKETFLVTLRGEAIAQPIVEVTLTFPSTAPSVTIENARFDGTDYPEFNGIDATVSPHAEGKLRLQANWGGKPFTYRIELGQIGQAGIDTYEPGEGDVGTDQSFDVLGTGEWRIRLQNTQGGFGITPMTATISWP